jgi:hypothetical protein
MTSRLGANTGGRAGCNNTSKPECNWEFYASAKRRAAPTRPFLSVPLGSNPSDADVSAARFAEKWINGLPIGSSANPHKSQPVFFRGNSHRPWDGPRTL